MADTPEELAERQRRRKERQERMRQREAEAAANGEPAPQVTQNPYAPQPHLVANNADVVSEQKPVSDSDVGAMPEMPPTDDASDVSTAPQGDHQSEATQQPESDEIDLSSMDVSFDRIDDTPTPEPEAAFSIHRHSKRHDAAGGNQSQQSGWGAPSDGDSSGMFVGRRSRKRGGDAKADAAHGNQPKLQFANDMPAAPTPMSTGDGGSGNSGVNQSDTNGTGGRLPFYARKSTWVIFAGCMVLMNLVSCGAGIGISTAVSTASTQSAINDMKSWIGENVLTPETDENVNLGDDVSDGSGSSDANVKDQQALAEALNNVVQLSADTMNAVNRADLMGRELDVTISNEGFDVNDAGDIVMRCEVTNDTGESLDDLRIEYGLYDEDLNEIAKAETFQRFSDSDGTEFPDGETRTFEISITVDSGVDDSGNAWMRDIKHVQRNAFEAMTAVELGDDADDANVNENLTRRDPSDYDVQLFGNENENTEK